MRDSLVAVVIVLLGALCAQGCGGSNQKASSGPATVPLRELIPPALTKRRELGQGIIQVEPNGRGAKWGAGEWRRALRLEPPREARGGLARA